MIFLTGFVLVNSTVSEQMAKQKWYLSPEQRFRALFRCLPDFFVCWFLHVRVIDLFEDISQLKIKSLQGNLKAMVEKCHNCEI